MYIIKESLTTSTINAIIKYFVDNEDKYNFLALRGDDILVKVGQTLTKSTDLNDQYGSYGRKLDGTSAYSISDPWSENSVRNQILNYIKMYDYMYLSVVTGTSYDYGDDNKEIVVKNCKVLATWKI